MKFIVYINGVRATKSDMERFVSDHKNGLLKIVKVEMTSTGAIAITYEN